jgi:hypothetical protein
MSNDCLTVYDLWTHWGKTTTVDRNSPTACCYGLEGKVQLTGIPGVNNIFSIIGPCAFPDLRS